MTEQPVTMQPVTEPPAEPTGRTPGRRHALLAGLLALVLFAIVASGVALALLGDSPAQAPAASAAAPPTVDLETTLPELKKFVATERGLPFTKDVPVNVVDDAAFRVAFDAVVARERPADADAREAGVDSTLVALKLFPARAAAAQAREATADGVVGFYDLDKDELFVRAGKGLTPYAEQILVHELTHALQDQHFDIRRKDLDDTTDEQGLALTALFEGDAVEVMNAWTAAQPKATRDALNREARELSEELGRDSAQLNAYDMFMYFPYIAGPLLVQQLRDDGGQEELDDAFAHPPVSSAQVLDLDSPAPVVVPLPAADGTVVDSGVFGQAGLAILLKGYPWTPRLSLAWRGDSYVTYTKGTQVCTRLDLVLDTPADATAVKQRLQTAYEVADNPRGRLSVRSCADGT